MDQLISVPELCLDTSMLAKIRSFTHSFHLMPKFEAFISTSHRLVWDVEEIRYRNFCSYSWNTWNFQHNWGQRSFVPLSQATTNHLITFSNANSAFGLQNSLRNGASAHLVCVRDASAFCATVQTVLQHRRKCFLVAIWKDVQGKVILKSFLGFNRSLAASASLSLTVHTSVNGFGLQQTGFRTGIPAAGTEEENFITIFACPIVSKEC